MAISLVTAARFVSAPSTRVLRVRDERGASFHGNRRQTAISSSTSSQLSGWRTFAPNIDFVVRRVVVQTSAMRPSSTRYRGQLLPLRAVRSPRSCDKPTVRGDGAVRIGSRNRSTSDLHVSRRRATGGTPASRTRRRSRARCTGPCGRSRRARAARLAVLQRRVAADHREQTRDERLVGRSARRFIGGRPLRRHPTDLRCRSTRQHGAVLANGCRAA